MRSLFPNLFFLRGMAPLCAFVVVYPTHAQGQDSAEFFERTIRPIFVEQCGTCHGEKVQMAGLKLTTAAGFRNGANGDPIVVAGDPAKSRLMQAVRYEGKIKMPPTGKLNVSQIEALEAWVAMGAPWPDAAVEVSTSSPAKQGGFTEKQLRHWAFQPVEDPQPPQVSHEDWVRTDADRFILARLEKEGLTPAAPADKLTLLRRAKFDLHGLPPTEDEIKEYLADTAPEAFERLIDRLLASARYGEKWGRHWLDVARYADASAHAWRYRDYVIDAFNRDLPYDQFVKEQIAGDLLPSDIPGHPNTRGIAATGFLALGPRQVNEQDKTRLRYDVIDEQIDTTSKAFLGLTISCSRCHDHKFDPILTTDYYSLAAIFAGTQSWDVLHIRDSTRYNAALVPESEYKHYKDSKYQVDAKQQEIDAFLENEVLDHTLSNYYPRVPDYLLAEWRVRSEGLAPAQAALQAKLEESVLHDWIEYLRPSDSHSDYKVFLENWHSTATKSARAEDVEQAARQYQAIFDVPAKRWVTEVRDWKSKLAEAAGKGDKLPGAARIEGKSFESVNDRFFVEVALSTLASNACRFFNKDLCGPAPFLIEGEERENVLSEQARQHLARLRRELDELQTRAPKAPPMACSVAEGEAVEQRVFLRGNPERQGDLVAKRFPVVLSNGDPTPAVEGSGRLELAKWITQPDHLLTARAMVNRIWQWHCGEGLVRTPNNFGLTGEEPTHPALLDYLAKRFVESGWSIKAMHRLVMNSSAYRMSSGVDKDVWDADPDNRLWSRFGRRRLTVEELRDSLLALDGALDPTVGGKLEPKPVKEGEEKVPVTLANSRRRTVYLPITRGGIPAMLRSFDFVDASTSTGKRDRTNVAPQALYMMNSPFVLERSRAFARYLLTDGSRDDPARIDRTYRLAWGRPPEAAKIVNALRYMAEYPVRPDASNPRLDAWAGFCRLLMSSNEFHYVD